MGDHPRAGGAGTTLLLTTQYLDEADELADEIVVIDQGQVIAAGTSEELKDRVGGDVLEFTVSDRSRLAVAVGAVAGLGEAEPHVDGGTGRVTHRRRRPRFGGTGRGRARHWTPPGSRCTGLGLRRPSLDDVFLALTGHAVEDDRRRPGGTAAGRATRPPPTEGTEKS